MFICHAQAFSKLTKRIIYLEISKAFFIPFKIIASCQIDLMLNTNTDSPVSHKAIFRECQALSQKIFLALLLQDKQFITTCSTKILNRHKLENKFPDFYNAEK